MNTKEILTIIALAALGLCLLCSLTKAVMKGDKGKKHCDKAGGAFVFLAIILLAVSQLLGEAETYEHAPTPMATKGGYCAGKNSETPPYIDTLTECCSDSECKSGNCWQCSNGICGVFQYYSKNAKKDVYVGGPVCRHPQASGTCANNDWTPTECKNCC